jgi:hypothetical protein
VRSHVDWCSVLAGASSLPVLDLSLTLCQAGRYYSKTATIKERKDAELKAQAQAASTLEPPPRTSTPFRELTEEEAMELKGLNEVDGPERVKGTR